MFNRILIANRGEIACRVIRTAKKMGIETIAVYSLADQNSQFVQLADRAYWVGDASAKSSYLNIDAIIKAAKASGAEAIHPGYGFLSENPQFARACEQAGIVFIGPSVSAMEAMASKQVAKQLLEKTSVPLTPGYHGSEQSDTHLLSEASRIGFPVLLKAASGGGGKGMRAVHQENDFLQALAGARREAMASFADDTMIIEKLVLNPRHVEVQVMADNHGGVVHLFERDCSIQRRHQKIIEEAPAPHLNEALRQRLAAAACEVARSIDYRGAGTVEFLVDGDHDFYFMEMNTRLQVEHPVTEIITGFDLVEWQIKIAANAPLPAAQEAIRQHGHAMECRIYAEDPHQGFIPSIGQIHFLKEPQGDNIRIDSGVICGSSITMYYDPMIAKLITWGNTRDEAIQHMQRALSHYAIGGVKTNIPFLQEIVANEAFVNANLSTDFLQQQAITLTAPDKKQALLMVAAYEYLELHRHQDPLLSQSFAWQSHLRSHWYCRYVIDGQSYCLKMQAINETQCLVTLEDEVSLSLTVRLHDDWLTLDDGSHQQSAWINHEQGKFYCYISGGPVIVSPYHWDDLGQQAGPQGQLTAPMPATVVAILKNKGDKVKEGERLIVLEAMKMEHTIHAPKNGTLAELYYEVGSQVQEGAQLLALQD